MGSVFLYQGDFPQARKHFEDALALRSEIGEKEASSDSMLDLARVSIEEGHAAEAQSTLTKVVNEIHQQKNADREAYARAILAHAFLAQNK